MKSKVSKSRRAPAVYLVSLGCPKNQVDSEQALGAFESQGFRIVKNPAAADVLVVNTCAFIRTAEEEAVKVLLEAAELKRRHGVPILAAAGCLVARYGEKKLRALIPEVDLALTPAEHRRKRRKKKQRGSCDQRLQWP